MLDHDLRNGLIYHAPGRNGVGGMKQDLPLEGWFLIGGARSNMRSNDLCDSLSRNDDILSDIMRRRQRSSW
jgi:hypothetical protein